MVRTRARARLEAAQLTFSQEAGTKESPEKSRLLENSSEPENSCETTCTHDADETKASSSHCENVATVESVALEDVANVDECHVAGRRRLDSSVEEEVESRRLDSSEEEEEAEIRCLDSSEKESRRLDSSEEEEEAEIRCLDSSEEEEAERRRLDSSEKESRCLDSSVEEEAESRRLDSSEEEEAGSDGDNSISERLPNKLLLDADPVMNTIGDQTTRCGLASSLQPGLSEDLYFSLDPEDVLTSASRARNMLLEMDADLLKKSVITADFEKKEVAPPISQSRFTLQKLKKAERERSTGKQWFDMPAPQLTPELKNDLKLLKMRNALDPSRHYKANDSKSLPRYFQVGKVVSGPADYYSSRLPRKQRKQTFVDELLANEEFTKYHKKKYLELQKKFMSGTKRHRNIKHKKSSKYK